MKNKGYYVNLLGIIFGIISFLIILLSLTFIIRNRAYIRHRGFSINTLILTFLPNRQENLLSRMRLVRIRGLKRIERELERGFEKIEGEETVIGQYKNITIKNVAGHIRISTWDEDYFLIKYIKTGPTFANIEALEVEVQTDKNSVYVRRNTRIKGLKNLGSISFEVFVPDTVVRISAESVSGDIELEGMQRSISQNLKTVSGRIETDNSADLTTKSTSGSITFQFSGKNLTARTVSGRIGGTLTDVIPGGSLDLGSVSGSIHLYTDKKLNAAVSLKSISGSVSCEHPMTVSIKKKNQLEGKIGDGIIPLEVKTTSGSIKIQIL